MLVLGLDQQPVLLAALVAAFHVHEVPAAFELAAAEIDDQVPLGQLLVRIALGGPAPAVPDDHAASAVLALGDAALEFAVVERMVLRAHRQPLVPRREAGAAGDGPAFQHTVELQAQIVMQPPRGMLVHHEQVATPALELAARLGGAREVALLMVLAQRAAGGAAWHAAPALPGFARPGPGGGRACLLRSLLRLFGLLGGSSLLGLLVRRSLGSARLGTTWRTGALDATAERIHEVDHVGLAL